MVKKTFPYYKSNNVTPNRADLLNVIQLLLITIS